MGLRRNRRGGGRDPFDERPQLTPEQAANAAYGVFSDIDRRRPKRLPVPLWDLVLDEAIQVRVGGLDEETVAKYTNILLEGGAFADPLIVYTASQEPPYIVADGFHRIAAHHRAYARLQDSPTDYDEVGDPAALLVAQCEVHYGTWEDAYANAEDANLTHGKALTLADRFNIFERRILRGHEWVRSSNGLIAQAVGVSHQTIWRWRQRVLERNPDSAHAREAVEGTERVSADGRVMNTEKLVETREAARAPEDMRRARKVAGQMKKLAEDLDDLAYGEAANELRGWLQDWKDRWGI